MRALAARLGVEAASLYNHIEGRADLLSGVMDQLLTEVAATPNRGRSPITRARRDAWRLREVLLAHPQAIQIFASARAPVSGPVSQALADRAAAYGAELGMPASKRVYAYAAVLSYVLGHVMLATTGPGTDDLSDWAGSTYDQQRSFTIGLDGLLEGLRRTLASREEKE